MLLVATFTSTTFLCILIVLKSTTVFPSKVDAFSLGTFYASLQILDSLLSCVHSNLIYDMQMIHFLNFLILSDNLYHCYSWFLFLFHLACVYIVIIYTIVCAMFDSLSCFHLWFQSCCSFPNHNINSALWAFVGVIPSSHTIIVFLCSYNVVHFIVIVVICR